MASQQLFDNYEPRTQVTDHSAIDLDQMELQNELGKKNDAGFQNALQIYTNGAHSKSVAEITLTTALATELPKGSLVTGPTVNGKTTTGKLYEAASANTNSIKVQYTTSDDRMAHVGCQVGASVDPAYDGCFANSGELTVGSTVNQMLPYSYDYTKNNVNKRTLQGFSTAAGKKMAGYVDYEKFRKYYGRDDYADHWILSAFEKQRTQFNLGETNFATVGFDGRAEAIKKGTAYMSIWMYVVRELEDALDDCAASCSIDGCNDDKVSAWDEAVAFYAGSNVNEPKNYLLYALANKRCANFMTCGEDGDEMTGNAYVNNEIFTQFNLGLSVLLKGKCADARKIKERIVQLMTVPLVQGSLRYAHIVGVQGDDSEKARMEGSVFTAAVLPMVNACSPSDAATIYDNMKFNPSSTPNFSAVKKAYENNYKCLGITCDDVGGLIDPTTGNYLAGANPCGTRGSGSVSLSFAVGVVTAIATTLYALW